MAESRSLLIDTAGKPRNIMFLKPLGTDLDKFALKIAEADRFTPGTSNGTPVVFAASLEVDIRACAEQKEDGHGNKTYWLHLRSLPVQGLGVDPHPTEEAILAPDSRAPQDARISADSVYKIGGEVSAPAVLFMREARFSNEARQNKYTGICVLSFIVDTRGMPQDVQVVKPLGFGLSEQAIKAVEGYRFKPAMKNGVPVPVKMSVEVAFNLY